MHRRLALFLLVSLSVATFSVAQKGKKREKPTLRDRTENTERKAEAALIEGQRMLMIENFPKLETYTKAYELFLVALELNPESAAIHYKLADVLLKMEQFDRAATHAEKARSIDPGNKYYHILAAEVHKSRGDLSKATEVYETMLSNIEGTEQYLYELAQLYQYQNKQQEALEAFERAEGYFGLSEAVLHEKQKAYLKLGDLDGLIEDWDQLIRESPKETRYVYKLADILISNKRYEQAKTRLETVRDEEENRSQVDLLLSELERKQGNLPEALQYLESPMKSDEITISRKMQILSGYLSYLPNPQLEEKLVSTTTLLANQFPEEYTAQAFAGDVLYQIGESEKAVDYYLNAIQLSPGNFSVWQNVINLEFQMAQYDSVVVHTDRALEFFPNQAIFYFFNGLGNYIKNDYQASVDALEMGKKYTADQSMLGRFYGQLGDAYNGLENHAKSDENYEAALKNDPNNDHVLNNYSYFLSLRKEKLEKARSMCERLMKLQPDNPTYLDTYGWVLYVSEDYKEARKVLKKAVEVDKESDGTILEHYGDVLFQLGEVEEAVIQWEKASRTDEASEFIQKKISERQIYE